MKKLVVPFLILFGVNSYSQGGENPPLFSTFSLGILGGANFSTFDNTGPSLIIEGRTNIVSKLHLKFSLGYSRSYQSDSYHINTYSIANIEGIETYQAESYDVTQKGYDFISFSIGSQYFLNLSVFSPYSLLEFSYNSIGTKIYKSSESIRSYASYNELPDEYKTDHKEIFVDESYKLGMGLGATYRLTAGVSLDFRYLYQLDNKLFNSHLFLVGITL